MSKLFNGVLIALATMTGIYAMASAIAASTVSGFSTSESDRHDTAVEFVSARNVGFRERAVPDSELYRAHRDFSDSRPDCFAPGDDDFKNKHGKTLSRVASN